MMHAYWYYYGAFFACCCIYFFLRVYLNVCKMMRRGETNNDATNNHHENDTEDLDRFRSTRSERRAVRRLEEEDSHSKQHQRLQHIRTQLYFQTLEDDDSTFVTLCKRVNELYDQQDHNDDDTFLSRSWRAAESSVRMFSKKECSICLDGYRSGETICLAKNAEDCMHIFHQDCIEEWLKNHDDCPLCRTNLMVLTHSDTSIEKEDV